MPNLSNSTLKSAGSLIVPFPLFSVNLAHRFTGRTLKRGFCVVPFPLSSASLATRYRTQRFVFEGQLSLATRWDGRKLKSAFNISSMLQSRRFIGQQWPTGYYDS